MVFPGTTDTEMGTDCNVSSRTRAVTTTSSISSSRGATVWACAASIGANASPFSISLVLAPLIARLCLLMEEIPSSYNVAATAMNRSEAQRAVLHSTL
jgi:hypothetical protein